MSEAARLVLQVQADRVPSDEPARDDLIWLAVQFTTGFEGAADGLPRPYAEALRPWSDGWTSHDGASRWSAHEQSNWEVWRLRKGEKTPTRETVTGVKSAGPGSTPSASMELLNTASNAVIERAFPSAESLAPLGPLIATEDQAGGSSQPSQGVPSWLARLPGLPHPLPSYANQHCLLEVSVDATRPVEKTDMFFAIPIQGKVVVQAGPAEAETEEYPLLKGAPAGQQLSVEEGEVPAWRIGETSVPPTAPPGVRVESYASRPWTDAAAASDDSARVMDLTSQLVRNSANNVYPNSARDTATLPQDIAAALDPLNRLEAALPRVFPECWKRLVEGLIEEAAETQEPPPSHVEQERANAEAAVKILQLTANALLAALDHVAAQVLGPVLDTVGPFEAPALEVLDRNEPDSASDANAREVLRGFMPPAHGSDRISATQRVSGKTVKYFSHSGRFTLDELPSSLPPVEALQAGLDFRIEVPPEGAVGCLKSFWGGVQSGPGSDQPINLKVRTLVLAPLAPEIPAPEAPARKLQLAVKVAGVTVAGGGTTSSAALPADIDWQAVRETMSLGFAAPFIEGLLAGLTDWSGQTSAPGPSASLAKRLEVSARSLLRAQADSLPADMPVWLGLYVALFQEALDAGMGTLDGQTDAPVKETVRQHVTKFLGLLGDACRIDAIDLIGRVGDVPDPNDCLTNEPLPLALMVDQLRAFSPDVDDWARVAGYGLMIRRKARDGNDPHFVSLARASISAVGLPEPKGDGAPQPPPSLVVDPVPTQPGDTVGMTHAVAEYANCWTVAPMPGADLMGAEGQESTAVQLVYNSVKRSSNPPGAEQPKIPALSYGYNYEWFAHLIGIGGVLAPFVRSKSSAYEINTSLSDGSNTNVIQTASYLRTVPVGIPAIKLKPGRPFIVDVAPLSTELPAERAGFLVSGNTKLRLNRDARTGRSLVRLPATEVGTASVGLELFVRIKTPVANVGQLKLVSIETGEAIEDLQVQIEPGLDALFQIRLFPHEPDGWLLMARRTVCTGDPVADPYPVGLSEPKDWSDWSRTDYGAIPQDVAFEFSGAGMLVQPWSIGPLEKAEQPEPPVDSPPQDRWRPLASLPLGAELASGGRVVLDGLRRENSNGLGPTEIRIEIQAPMTGRANFERWVNAALFSNNQTLKAAVAKTLNRLQNLPAPEPATGKGEERLCQDPAVDGLHVTLVQVFPKREVIGAPFIFNRDALPQSKDGIADWLEKPISALVDVVVAENAAFNPPLGTGPGRATIKRGAVYQLEVRAAIKLGNCPFTGTNPAGLMTKQARLGPAVLETFSNDGTWLLGAVAAVSLEAATELAGEVKLSSAPANANGSLTFEVREITALDRGPSASSGSLPGSAAAVPGATSKSVGSGMGRRAGVFFKGPIEGLAAVGRVQLLPQRWSWRGQPVLDQVRLQRPTGAGLSIPFEGRDEASIGRVAEVRPNWKQLVLSTKLDRSSPILSRDLDWRGGWNLWRFKIEVENRYRAFFRPVSGNDPKGLAVRTKDWEQIEIKDRDTGRAALTPAPAIIVPLTEPLDSGSLTPPLLALFHGGWHQNDHYGDSLIPIVEAVEHPYPPPLQAADGGDPSLAKLSPNQKRQWWPEAGPDPIRSTRALGQADKPENEKRLLFPVTLDGPIGYGFDAGVEGGKHTSTGFLIRPALADDIPWTFAKLAFRRLELPEGLDAPEPKLSPGEDEAQRVSVPIESINGFPKRIAMEALVMSARGELNTEFALSSSGDTPFRIEAVVEKESPTVTINLGVRIAIPNDPLGGAYWSHGSHTFKASIDQVEWRVIASPAVRKLDQPSWFPQVDLIIQIQIKDESATAETVTGRWITLMQATLNSRTAIQADQEVRLWMNKGEMDRLTKKYARLSAPSPARWSQFTIASSTVATFIPEQTGPVPVPVDSIGLTKFNKDKYKFTCRGKFGNSVKDIVLLAEGVAPGQRDVLFGLVTNYVFDVMGRQVEQPLFIAPIQGEDANPKASWISFNRSEAVWTNPLDGSPVEPDKQPLQLRLIRALVRNKGSSKDKEKFLDMLMPAVGKEPDEDYMNPENSEGMILSISKPIKIEIT